MYVLLVVSDGRGCGSPRDLAWAEDLIRSRGAHSMLSRIAEAGLEHATAPTVSRMSAVPLGPVIGAVTVYAPQRPVCCRDRDFEGFARAAAPAALLSFAPPS